MIFREVAHPRDLDYLHVKQSFINSVLMSAGYFRAYGNIGFAWSTSAIENRVSFLGTKKCQHPRERRALNFSGLPLLWAHNLWEERQSKGKKLSQKKLANLAW